MPFRITLLCAGLICGVPCLRAQVIAAGPNGLGDGQIRARPLPGAPQADASSRTLEMARLPTTVVSGDAVTSQVVVAFAGVPAQTLTLAAAPLTPATLQALGQLRLTLAGLYNRLGAATSARAYAGMPQVDGNFGISRSPIVHVSARDRENAQRQAEAAASLALERFQRDSMPLKAAPGGSPGEFRFAALPPGLYVLCGLCRIKDSASTAAVATKRAVWWTTLRVGPHDQVNLALAPGNAIDWTGVFKFPRSPSDLAP